MGVPGGGFAREELGGFGAGGSAGEVVERFEDGHEGVGLGEALGASPASDPGGLVGGCDVGEEVFSESGFAEAGVAGDGDEEAGVGVGCGGEGGEQAVEFGFATDGGAGWAELR